MFHKEVNSSSLRKFRCQSEDTVGLKLFTFAVMFSFHLLPLAIAVVITALKDIHLHIFLYIHRYFFVFVVPVF